MSRQPDIHTPAWTCIVLALLDSLGDMSSQGHDSVRIQRMVVFGFAIHLRLCVSQPC